MCARGRASGTREVLGRGERNLQQVAGDSETWRSRMAEGFVLPRKPGNAGGGKEPWFKADAGSNEVCEIGIALGNSRYRQEL